MKNPYAIGKSVYLRAPDPEDINGNWYQWFSDPEVTQYLGDRYWPNTRELQADFFESIKNSRERLVLCICLSETDEHIGVCNLSAINWVHRHADIALIIGEKKYRNGLVAVETMSLLLNIAFNRLNLQNIRASHIATNPSTSVLLKIFGFREAGRLNKFSYFNGDYFDSIFSQISRADWANRNKR